MSKPTAKLAAGLAVAKEPACLRKPAWPADNGNGTFTNPLFYNEFSGPALIWVGTNYYLTGTTRHAVPGEFGRFFDFSRGGDGRNLGASRPAATWRDATLSESCWLIRLPFSFLFLMKRLLFLLSSCWLLAGSAQAQIGMRAGGELSFFSKNTDEAYNYTNVQRKLGYQVGIFYQVPLRARLALVPEVQFNREHFAVDRFYVFGDGAVHSQYDQSLSYVNLPILLRASRGGFYVEAGPQLSWLVGGRATGTQTVSGGFTGIPYTYSLDEAATASYHRLEVGPCVGVGVKLPAGFGLGLRAYWGLTKPIADASRSSFGFTYPSFQHRHTLQASLTYQLHGS
ncbi:MAG: outer membrane beta-barrel protein [Janthinobacterium lividum]